MPEGGAQNVHIPHTLMRSAVRPFGPHETLVLLKADQRIFRYAEQAARPLAIAGKLFRQCEYASETVSQRNIRVGIVR